MKKIRRARVTTAATTDAEIKTTPIARRSLATEILTHRKFVKLQYLFPRIFWSPLESYTHVIDSDF